MEEVVRRRDADRSRVAILDAAETLFAERGYDAVTMAQIGAAAGLSRGTPGYFFSSKGDLHRAVRVRAEATVRMLPAALEVRDAAARRDRQTVLSDAVEAFLNLLSSRPALVPLASGPAPDGGAPAHAEAVRRALPPDVADAETAAVALALCWFPFSEPGAARALGVDPGAPDFVPRWRDRVVAACAAVARPSPPDGPGVSDATPAPEVPGRKKKKKKKKNG
jgi:AcrR family transcriptional regulator